MLANYDAESMTMRVICILGGEVVKLVVVDRIKSTFSYLALLVPINATRKQYI